jgi:hypothetical protein
MRVAYLAPELRLHRGLVAAFDPGWRAAALPLDAGNDDETPPFPAAIEAGGAVADPLPPSTALVLYRVLTATGAPTASGLLRVVKEPGSAALRLSY